MALFFDTAWFDARLASLGLGRDDLGRVLGLAPDEVAEMFKDQREVSAADVTLLAALLGVPAADVASRAGVSTPVPRAPAPGVDILERLERIERELAELKALIARRPG